jgi:hypothetical protein
MPLELIGNICSICFHYVMLHKPWITVGPVAFKAYSQHHNMKTQYLSFTVLQIINSEYFVRGICYITLQEEKGIQTISMRSVVFNCTLLYNDNSYKPEQSANKM